MYRNGATDFEHSHICLLHWMMCLSEAATVISSVSLIDRFVRIDGILPFGLLVHENSQHSQGVPQNSEADVIRL